MNFRYKFNTNIPSLKINISERKITLLLRFFNNLIQSNTCVNSTIVLPAILKEMRKDRIRGKFDSKYLRHVQSSVRIFDTHIKTRRRSKSDKNGIVISKEKRYMLN